MSLGLMCLRRMAIVAALVGGTLIAVASAGWCARGMVWGGHACAAAMRSGLSFFGY